MSNGSSPNWAAIGTAIGMTMVGLLGTGGVAMNGSSRLEEANQTRMVGVNFLAEQLERTQKNILMIYEQKETMAAELREVRDKYEACLSR